MVRVTTYEHQFLKEMPREEAEVPCGVLCPRRWEDEKVCVLTRSPESQSPLGPSGSFCASVAKELIPQP